MKIPSSDSSNSDISTFLYTAALVCVPTVINMVANRVLKSLRSEETASKYTPYITLIPLSILMGYNLSIFGGSLVIFLVYQIMSIQPPPLNSDGFVIWNPQMSCIIADRFVDMIENDKFIISEELYGHPLEDAPPFISILDRFAYQTPYKPDIYDRLINKIVHPNLQPAEVESSFKSILLRLDAPLLTDITQFLASDAKEPIAQQNIKAAIATFEPYRRSFLRKVISHLHLVSTKQERYHMTSDRLAQVFEPLLFGKLPEPQARIAMLKLFIENPALYSLDKISTA